MRQLVLFLLCFVGCVEKNAAQTIHYQDATQLLGVASQAQVLEDKSHLLTLQNILETDVSNFKHFSTAVLNFENTVSKFWIKFEVKNETAKELYLLLDNPEVQNLNLYVIDENNVMRTVRSGGLAPFTTRDLSSTPFSFSLGRFPKTVIFEASTYTGFTFPLTIGAIEPIVATLHRTDLFNGIYIGLMAAMILYNLFIFFTTRSRTYFYYFIYISISAFMMMRFRGMGFDMLWRDMPFINKGSNLFPCLTVISSVLFSTDYLNMRQYTPKVFKFFWFLSGLAGVIIITDFLKIQPFSNIAFQTIGGITAISLLVTAIYIYLKGHKIAKFYIIAWAALLICTIILMLALNGILPVNFFTLNAFQIGSGIEAILLSIALADRINIYKAEREVAQQLAFAKMQENERLIKEQNMLLEEKVQSRTAELIAEKEKSETLLLNILPETIANELKINGKASPRRHEDVSVMFIDVKDFTRYSETISPEQLVENLDFMFKGFDKIIAKHRVEKIKTIGDAYLCASGLPNGNPYHAQEILRAATEILDFIQTTKSERPFFDIRIGIHSGPVVAGVVGDSKFAYDIWGDTVNMAARMEQNSEAGKINISQDTFHLVKDLGRFAYRGKIEAKNKGEIDMYFWEG
jgi:class 3 adenylate cyclase